MPHGNGSEKVTAVARRILPSLRNYSSWIIANSALLVAQVGDTSLNVQIKELWKIYANSLTLLAATFPAQDLPSVDYLLDEDEDTIGFNPLDVERVKRRYTKEDGSRKPRWHDPGVARYHPNKEMLARIRDLLTDGLELALDEVSIILKSGLPYAKANPRSTDGSNRSNRRWHIHLPGRGPPFRIPGKPQWPS